MNNTSDDSLRGITLQGSGLFLTDSRMFFRQISEPLLQNFRVFPRWRRCSSGSGKLG